MLKSFKTFKQAVEITLAMLGFFAIGTVISFAAMQRQNELLQEQVAVQQRTIDAMRYEVVVINARVQLNEKRLTTVITDMYSGKAQMIPFVQGMIFAQE